MEIEEEQPNGEKAPPNSGNLLILNFPNYGSALRFKSFAQIENWVEKERLAWSKVPAMDDFSSIGANLAVQEHRKFFNQFATELQQLSKQEDDPAVIVQLAGGLDKFAMLKRGEILPLTGLRGRRFQQLLDDDPTTAAGLLLWAWTNPTLATRFSEPQIAQAFLVRAMTEARIDELEGKGELDAVKSQLEELAEDWDGRARAHVDAVAAVEGDISRTLADTKATANDSLKVMKEVSDGHKAEIQRIQQNYDNLMTLKGPAEYWLTKKKDHFVVARRAFIAFAVAVAIVIGVVWWQGESIVGMLKDDNGIVGLGSIVLITIPALAFFWFLRLISRIFVTNLHLMADARLRATMVSTFHALMKDDTNPVSSDERLLVLQALFRPASEGGDDAAPTNLMEKIISGRATGSGSS